MKKLKHRHKEISGAYKALTYLCVVLICSIVVLPLIMAVGEVMSKASPGAVAQMVFILVFPVLLVAGFSFLAKFAIYRQEKIKLEEMDTTASTAYSDDVMKLSQQAVEMQVSLPVAWDCLKEASNGLDIKALDKRRASWLVDSVDDHSHTVKCSLQYMQDPLGRKLSQIYLRTVEMVASVDGAGPNTRLRMRYTFPTPMDLTAVSEIISKTNSRLNEMIVTADKSYREQRERRDSFSVGLLEKPMELDLKNLGSIDLPISLN